MGPPDMVSSDIMGVCWMIVLDAGRRTTDDERDEGWEKAST